MDAARRRASDLARAASQGDQPLAWFEAFYAEAGGDMSRIPWADLEPNPALASFLAGRHYRRALIVACGLGDDAELACRHADEVMAFDISPTAVAWCRRRFPSSSVRYEQADVTALPWPDDRYDFIFEANTLQTMPAHLRAPGFHELTRVLAPGGHLLVLCRGREEGDPAGDMPWPLTRAELDAMRGSLEEVSFEDFMDHHVPPVRRFQVLYRKSS